MRVTLDTNVLVSAFISKRGDSADVLDLIATFDEITLVLSKEILEEFNDVMSRKEVATRFDYSRADISRFEVAVRDVAEVVPMKSSFKAVREDPDDDVVVNTAVDGRADYIVSGDRHLRELKKFRGVRIVSPKIFLSILTKRFGDLVLSEDDFV
ncbi:MAG: putative toxin-antitoxin system toxin component, PIN family [Thaumarchaeota archaeon]|nr:putative toxin-antitoxin system toxin component, PIN family [Nitrososphaerota archaeon]